MLEDYHNKVFILVLYYFLNLRHIVAPSLNSILLNDSMFGFPSSLEEASEGLLKLELSLYCAIGASIKYMIFFLLLCKEHENKFPNVGFLGLTYLGHF